MDFVPHGVRHATQFQKELFNRVPTAKLLPSENNENHVYTKEFMFDQLS